MTICTLGIDIAKNTLQLHGAGVRSRSADPDALVRVLAATDRG